MVKKLQIAFCVLIGIGIVVFFVAMITNVNVPTLPKWLSPVAWGSFGLMVVCSLGVVVTLAMDRERVAKPKRVVEKVAESDSETEHAEEEAIETDESHSAEGELPVESGPVESGISESGIGPSHPGASRRVESGTIDTGFADSKEEIFETPTHSPADTLDEATAQFEPHEAAHEPDIDFEDFK